MPTRRDFLKSSAVLAGGFPALARLAESTPALAPLNILVLGGTGFIGPHLVRYAALRGHRVTIFTRGRHDAELPESVIRLQGDRNGQLDSLKGKKWDAVVDDRRRLGRQSTALLKNSVGNYLFTSSTVCSTHT